VSYDQIAGFSGFLPLYDQAVAEAKDGAVMCEVGVALGHSLAYLARLVLDSKKRITVYGIDPFGGYARNGEQQAALGEDGTRGDFRLFLDNMIQFAPEELELVRVLRVTSEEAARMFMPKSLDLVLIDAAHDQASVFMDVSRWKDTIKPGGILAGDDHEPNYPGVALGVQAHFGHDYFVRGSTWSRRM
jgi:predicted O-methyltransferase YrrM